MYQIIIVVHILLGLAIIGLVLMQQGKGADAGATFGGGASGSVFGAQGAASFLSRTTAILATLFFLTSLGLAFLNSHKSADINDLMSSPAVENEKPDSGLPTVGGTKPDMATPTPAENKGADQQTPATATDKPTPPAGSEPKTPNPATAAPTTVEQPKAEAAPVAKEKPAELKKESEAKADTPAKTPEKGKK